VDAQGVAFAAIQGLYRIVQEKEAQNESLQAQLQYQQAENQALHARVEALERLVKDVLGAALQEKQEQ
jgi:cell division protein FtsB